MGAARASSAAPPSQPDWRNGDRVTRTVVSVDALVLGAGPAGLAAATALRAGGAGRVLVLDREDEAGGTPRLCEHTGFGLRDLRRVLSGPAYARRWVERASAGGVDIWTRSMVTGWTASGQAEVTGPDGLLRVGARAVVLATGARERPRAARLVPGSRPSGIFTTGQLQQWVHRQRLPLSGRALIVGAEHVSYSAVLTLREAGVHPVALVTDLPRTQTFRPFDVATRFGLGVPVWTGTSVIGVTGHDRVDGVLVRDSRGAERTVAVDVVVFTGDFIPDNELARLAQLAIDPGTNGPACDVDGATSAPGVFAAGNLVHPAETADVAARRAMSVGRAAAAWLCDGDRHPVEPAPVRLRVADPLLWVVPNLAGPGRAGTGSLLVRTREFLDRPRLEVTQGGRLLGSFRPRRLIPNRSHALPSDWMRLAQPGVDVLLSVS
jgi:thioredoxin reductase